MISDCCSYRHGSCTIEEGTYYENRKIELLTDKIHPIKAITQQDINALEVTHEQLQSWSAILEVLPKLFDCEKEPINKERLFKITFRYEKKDTSPKRKVSRIFDKKINVLRTVKLYELS